MSDPPAAPRQAWPTLLALLMLVAAGGATAASLDELQQSADPAALLDGGKRYFYGVQAPQSIDRAIQLFCQAARYGSPEAQYRLGDIYARTLAGKRDEVLAAAWLLRAARSRYHAAKARLALWDLTTAVLPAEPPCVLSGQMVARTLPRPSRDVAPSQSPAPEAAANPLPAMAMATKSPTRAQIERLVRALAPEFGLNPELVLAVVEVESNFIPTAQSPKRAQGLMQLIPATASRFGVTDPWDAHQNLRGGMAYLRWLLDHFDGDLSLALAGYNAGEKAVQNYGGIPPYVETQNYVRRVARALGVSEEGLGTVDARPRAVARPALGGGDGQQANPHTTSQRRLVAMDEPG
ncbi:transglycosylase SLT domain-containing protein [uncultured Thiodictyon sp.]|uniref:transglycosylase SLT domain-containing protein n=1 Tax=uncultured Thiodictyon sp. TaxID=1846217 RepID=UPI0025E82481|nr:transglycosylase SLT domain-containing protein [uncultured Thiodictyon sp.]